METYPNHITEEQARQIRADTLEEIKQSHWAHDRARNAGVALTATIIALSSGGLYKFFDPHPIAASFFLIPILLSVLQQFAHYTSATLLGRGLTAHAKFVVESRVLEPNAKNYAKLHQLEKEAEELLETEREQGQYAHFLAKFSTTSFVAVSSILVGTVATWWLVLALVIVLIAFRFRNFRTGGFIVVGRVPVDAAKPDDK
jgi:hypothetical protein